LGFYQVWFWDRHFVKHAGCAYAAAARVSFPRKQEPSVFSWISACAGRTPRGIPKGAWVPAFGGMTLGPPHPASVPLPSGGGSGRLFDGQGRGEFFIPLKGSPVRKRRQARKTPGFRSPPHDGKQERPQKTRRLRFVLLDSEPCA